MELVERLGLWHLLWPLAFWVPLFLLSTGLLGLSTLRRARRQLVAAGQPTRAITAWAGLLLLVLLPLGAAYLGGDFAFKRALARSVESGSDEIIGWSVKKGGSAMQAALGLSNLDRKLPAAELRAMLGTELAGNAHADHLSASRIGDPLAAVSHLPRVVERAFWQACDSVLARLGNHEVTWNEIELAARVALHATASRFFSRAAAQLYSAAHADLWALVISIAIGHALVLTFVWSRCRKRLNVKV